MAEAAVAQVTRPRVRKEDGGGNYTTYHVVKKDLVGGDGYVTIPGGKYNHPIYKKLAIMNGEINKLSKEEIKDRLEELKLDTRGVKEVLKKRLKNHYKRLKLTTVNMKRPRDKAPPYDFYMVIDFEATCEEYNINYKHEIIEFPIVLVDARERKVVKEFHSYVRPVINSKLTEFCTQLTGISQEQVKSSPVFSDVLDNVTAWMEEQKLGTDKKFAVVTDGPWDMGRFMYQQCRHSHIAFPNWARKWVNLRKAYRNFYKCKKYSLKLNEMLLSLGMAFQGQEHSGIDDSRNIARVLLHMMADGASMKINEELYSYKIHNYPDAGTAEMKVGPVPAETSSDSSDEETAADGRASSERVSDDASGSLNSRSSGRNCNAVAASKANDVISIKLKKLSINEGAPPRECSDTEEYDDLLAYYALQKA